MGLDFNYIEGQTPLDEDEKEALRCLKEILIPKLEAVRSQIRCRPSFELEAWKRDVEKPQV